MMRDSFLTLPPPASISFSPARERFFPTTPSPSAGHTESIPPLGSRQRPRAVLRRIERLPGDFPFRRFFNVSPLILLRELVANRFCSCTFESPTGRLVCGSCPFLSQCLQSETFFTGVIRFFFNPCDKFLSNVVIFVRGPHFLFLPPRIWSTAVGFSSASFLFFFD